MEPTDQGESAQNLRFRLRFKPEHKVENRTRQIPSKTVIYDAARG
jgi:hypothetical protein